LIDLLIIYLFTLVDRTKISIQVHHDDNDDNDDDDDDDDDDDVCRKMERPTLRQSSGFRLQAQRLPLTTHHPAHNPHPTRGVSTGVCAVR
jgi:hypothetical protein